MPSLPPPPAPNGAPPWAVGWLKNFAIWVENKLLGPFQLTSYTSSNQPPTTTNPGALIYDSTNAVPAFSTGSAWTDLVKSGGAASFTTLSITAGAIISGTYLPTLTNVANLDGSTAYTAQYMRVGNVVTVSGKVDVDPTALLSTKLGISFPIASTVSAAEKCGGVAISNTIASEAAAIEADTANNRAQMEWIAVSVANHSMYFSFTYLIT